MILHTKILVRISMASVTLFYLFPKQLLIDQDLNFGRNLWSTTHTFIALHCGPHRLTVEVLKNRAPSDRSIRLIWPVWLEMG